MQSLDRMLTSDHPKEKLVRSWCGIGHKHPSKVPVGTVAESKPKSGMKGRYVISSWSSQRVAAGCMLSGSGGSLRCARRRWVCHDGGMHFFYTRRDSGQLVVVQRDVEDLYKHSASTHYGAEFATARSSAVAASLSEIGQ